jgi:hypothetical protein
MGHPNLSHATHELVITSCKNILGFQPPTLPHKLLAADRKKAPGAKPRCVDATHQPADILPYSH